MSTEEEPTTLSTWASAIARTLECEGLDASLAFQQAGLDILQARDPNARYPVSGMTRLWQVAVAMTGNPAIGLKVAEQVQPASLHALGLSVLASATLDDALQRIARYSRLVSNAADVQVNRQGQEVRVSIHIPDHGVMLAHEAFDAFIGNMVKMGRMLTQRDLSPLRVEFMRPQPVDPHPYRAFFRTTVEFEAPACCIYFDAAYLDEPLPSANPALAQLNDQVVVDYLARFDRNQVAVQVRDLIIQRLPSGEPSQEDVARCLNMSTRSLQRRLTEEDSSYKLLLEDTRKSLACQYLKKPDISLGEVTYLLGFSDQSNFSRAFKRWVGKTPGEYRTQLETEFRSAQAPQNRIAPRPE